MSVYYYMKLIVGLGNPGEKYASTRHNIGFMVVDQVVKDLVSVNKTWSEQKDIKAAVFKTEELVCVKPLTFMNASGYAVKKLVDLYKIALGDIWVVHDDIDLPLGKIRIRIGGGSAGHHGIESIMRTLGNQDGFVRFRLGVGRTKLEEKQTLNPKLVRPEIEKYVVSVFHAHEAGEVRNLIKHTAKAIETGLKKGIEKAMNQFN